MYTLRAKINHLYWSEEDGKMMDRASATLYATREEAQERIDRFADLDEDQQYRWTIEEAE